MALATIAAGVLLALLLHPLADRLTRIVLALSVRLLRWALTRLVGVPIQRLMRSRIVQEATARADLLQEMDKQ